MIKGTERPPRNLVPGNGRRCRFRELTTVGSPVRGGLKMRSSTAGENCGLDYADSAGVVEAGSAHPALCLYERLFEGYLKYQGLRVALSAARGFPFQPPP